MGYPENVLAPGEDVVKHLHPHWLTVAFPTVLLVVVVGAASFGVAVIPAGDAQMILRIIVLALAVVLLVALVLVPFIKWRTTHYVITTHRVMVRRGVLTRTGKDVALSKITDVSFSQTLWERIIGSGTLNVESAGDSADEVLHNIPHSNDVQQLINHLVEEDQNRRSAQFYGGGRQVRGQQDYEDGYDDPPQGQGWEPTQPDGRNR